MFTIGFGILSEYSRSRVPRPPQNRTTFMVWSTAFLLSRSRVDLHVRDRYNELSPPRLNQRHLLHDLVLEIPRQDEDVVRPSLEDPLRWVDGYVGARREPALLVRVAVHRVVEEVRPDPAVVQECVALPGCPVPDDGPTLTLGPDQELQQPALALLHPLPEGRVSLEPIETSRLLARQERLHP